MTPVEPIRPVKAYYISVFGLLLCIFFNIMSSNEKINALKVFHNFQAGRKNPFSKSTKLQPTVYIYSWYYPLSEQMSHTSLIRL
jgi:hypothetical protein